MELKTLLGITSAIVGAGIVIQDPSFEHPGLQPIVNTNPEIQTPQDKRVTARFKQASAEEILDWLSNQGVNFVTTGMPKDVKVDLSLTDVTLTEAIQVVGRVLGGTFVRQGNTYVFHKGAGTFETVAPLVYSGHMDSKMLAERALKATDVKVQKLAQKEMELAKGVYQLAPSRTTLALPSRSLALREMELAQGRRAPVVRFFEGGHEFFQDSKFWDSFRQDFQKHFGAGSTFMKELQSKGAQDPAKWEAFGKEMEKRFGPGSKFETEMRFFGEQHAKEMQKRFGPGSAFEKDVKVYSEQHAKEMQKVFGPGSQFQKDMKVFNEQHAKEMQKAFGPGSQFEKDMKAFTYENGKYRELNKQEREKLMKELESKIRVMPTPIPPTMTIPAYPRMAPKEHQKLMKEHEEIMKNLETKVKAMPKLEGRTLIPAVPPTASRVTMRGTDVSAVAKTLTPAQRAKNKSQGFLYWSDLTKEQQAMLGAGNWSGNWSITYTKDGETFTIKSDR